MHCSFLIGPLIQSTMSEARPELQEYDQEQIEMMKEACILVDEEDNILGKDTKINCHLGEGKLHRAFSILLFNNSGNFEYSTFGINLTRDEMPFSSAHFTNLF